MGSDITILGGGNGTGKTSVFDAVQWAVLGNVERLTGSRDFLAAGDVLRNRFCQYSEPASASAFFNTEHGLLELWRTEKEHKAVLAEKPISIQQAYELLGLNTEDPYTSFMRGRMLTQEEISQFISASPRERYDQLKALLPIFQMSMESAFAEEIETVHKQLAVESERLQTELIRVRNQLSELRKDEALLTVREGAAILSDAQFIQEEASLVAEAATAMQIETSRETDSKSMAAMLDARLKELQSRQDELRALKAGFNDAQRVKNQIDTALAEREKADLAIEKTTAESVEAQRRLADLQLEIRRLSEQEEVIRNQHSEFVKVLTSIDQFITKDECPVCEQAIKADALRSLIRSKVESRDLPYAILQQDIERRRNEAASLQTSVIKLQDELRQLRSLRLQASQTHDASIAQNITFDRRLESIAESFAMPITSQNDIERIQDRLADQILKVQAFLGRVRNLRERREASDRSSLLKSKHESIGELSEAEKTLENGSRRVAALVGLVASARTAIRDAQVNVVSRVLQQYQPFIEQLFGRLKPHPVFSQFLMDVATAYKEGELYLKGATPEGVSVHINTVFSMAQRNGVALCIFLALNLSLGTEKQFAFIDDPIQSMDDLNTLELVDLFRELRPFRQFIVSTHDRRFFNLLLEKMRPSSQGNDVRAYWFESWDRGGPTMTELAPLAANRTITLDEVNEILMQESAA